MFIVLIGGQNSQRESFIDFIETIDNGSLIFINKHQAFYPVADLFVYFGGPVTFPEQKNLITWSGDHQETLERIHKTLGLE
jgi:hypothetical protein